MYLFDMVNVFKSDKRRQVSTSVVISGGRGEGAGHGVDVDTIGFEIIPVRKDIKQEPYDSARLWDVKRSNKRMKRTHRYNSLVVSRREGRSGVDQEGQGAQTRGVGRRRGVGW